MTIALQLNEEKTGRPNKKLPMSSSKEASFVDLLSWSIRASAQACQKHLRRFFKRHFVMKSVQRMQQRCQPEEKATHDPSRNAQPSQKRADQRRTLAGNIIGQSGRIGPLQAKRQTLQDFLEYRSAKARFSRAVDEPHVLFKHFLTTTADYKCLYLSFDADAAPELGPNWETVDLCTVESRTKELCSVSLDYEDHSFDAVLCTDLDRMSRPEGLITELKRVLKPAGQIWVEALLNGPYFDAMNPAQTEYWRITPDGLRILLENVDEIFCSIYLPSGSALRTCSFYYGLKSPGGQGG